MRAIVRLLRNLYVAGRLSGLTVDQMVTTELITSVERDFIVAPD